jgi:class 3 adenylate cyclase
MEGDEEGTLTQLKAHRSVLVDVVDAVRCAVDVQQAMAQRNADLPQDKRIEFRIGINIGDIIEDGGDIFEDGVNVAVRLEGISDRGGICISRNVLDQVVGKLDLSFRERAGRTSRILRDLLRSTRSISIVRDRWQAGCSPARTSGKKFDTATRLVAFD